MRVKNKTTKAQRTQDEKAIYHSVTKPNVLARDPICKRCNIAPSIEGHHRKGVEGKQDGIPLRLYEPLIMGVCRDCHTYIETHKQEAYDNMWSYHRNRGELPQGWQEMDWVLHPELRGGCKKLDLVVAASDAIDLGKKNEVEAFVDFIKDSAA
jgi:hypothetical protein